MPKGRKGEYQSAQLYGEEVVFSGYKANARRKGLVFTLTKADVVKLINQPCVYCGAEPTPRSNFGHVVTARKHPGVANYLKDKTYLANGIDRKDNHRGYELDNCVPCCTMCNTAKSNWTEEQWEAWINRIVAFRTSS